MANNNIADLLKRREHYAANEMTAFVATIDELLRAAGYVEVETASLDVSVEVATKAKGKKRKSR
jgi:hypothetical protein